MIAPGETIVITGALSYTSKYATRLLLDRGYRVRTLTFHTKRENPFGDKVRIFPYDFDRPDRLTETLRGASAFINTYWVRFPHGASTFESAVQNTRILIGAAKAAEVKRVVQLSIANPSAESPLGYYHGKAQLEKIVRESGLGYTILRPTVIFGPEDILINNIAWFLRRFRVFGVPGDGRYGIRPVYVEDMAKMMVDALGHDGNVVLDAVGPETFTFDELVKLIGREVGRSVHLLHLPMPLAYLFTRLLGWFLGDLVLTWEEYRGLMAGLLAPAGPSTGKTRLSEWLAENRERIGARYASEVARHYAKPS